jgi:hypothetical protein
MTLGEYMERIFTLGQTGSHKIANVNIEHTRRFTLSSGKTKANDDLKASVSILLNGVVGSSWLVAGHVQLDLNDMVMGFAPKLDAPYEYVAPCVAALQP